MNLLELQKYVLQCVYVDRNLFEKELRKSLEWLDQNESTQLLDWVQNEFGNTHSEIISNVFNAIVVKV